MIATHSPTPWRDPGEHALTGYGDINHVILGADGKTVGSLYANCFNAPHMKDLPSVKEAWANAAFIVEAVNSHEALKARIQELESKLIMLDGTRALEGIGIDTHATMVALCKTLTAKQIAAEKRSEELEAELAICRPKAAAYDACSSQIDCLSRGEAMKDGS
jgi:hypothetical protein